MSEIITAKCSLHIGRKMSREHNLRTYDRDKWNKDGHINESRKELNKVLTDETLIAFFHEKFGAALDRYNVKQRPKHPERLIGFKNAADYDNCPTDQRQVRAVKAYYAEHRKNAREAIVQFGDHSEYMQMVETIGKERADELYCKALEAAYDEWIKANPTFAVFSAVIHLDEDKEGTPHMHLDYIPIVGSEKGLTVKVSMEGALAQIKEGGGFGKVDKSKGEKGYERAKSQKYSETPFRRWLGDYRTHQESVFQNYWNEVKGIDVIVLPAEPTKENVHHSDPQVYRNEKSKQSAMQKIKESQKIKKAAKQIVENVSALTSTYVKEATAHLHDEREQLAKDRAELQRRENSVADREAAIEATTKSQRERAKELDELLTSVMAREKAAAVLEQELETQKITLKWERYSIDIAARSSAEKLLLDGGYTIQKSGFEVQNMISERTIENERNE